MRIETFFSFFNVFTYNFYLYLHLDLDDRPPDMKPNSISGHFWPFFGRISNLAGVGRNPFFLVSIIGQPVIGV